jgi:hypothetical protein
VLLDIRVGRRLVSLMAARRCRRIPGALCRAGPVLAGAIVAVLVGAVPAAAAIVTNGDFETGALTGWTTYTTANGTVGTPGVAVFDTTGSGATNAARFNVGQASVTGPSDEEGGGIRQPVTLSPGNYDLAADIASAPAPGFLNNADCGTFSLFLGGALATAHSFGGCGGAPVVRARLSKRVQVSTGGANELRVLITRHYGSSSNSPSEYIDNIVMARAMQVACSPGSVAVDASTTCTATEAGNGTAPTGTVTFATGSTGSFSPPSCVVVPSGNSAQCSVGYKPSQVDSGTHVITANYGGNLTYPSDTSSTTVAVTPSASASQVTISPTAFPAAPSGPSAQASKPTTGRRYGAKVSYKLNQNALVRFTVQQAKRGRKKGKGKRTRCVPKTRKNRKARTCKLIVTLRGSFTQNGRAGANSFRFTGRLRRKALKPGKYTLVATPSANGRKGRSARASFRIIK